jgi:hypothetical protein
MSHPPRRTRHEQAAAFMAETERPAAVYLAVAEHVDADVTDYDLAPLPRHVVHAEAPAIARSGGWSRSCAPQ